MSVEKPIHLSKHAQARMPERNFSFQQVETTIREAAWEQTDLGRFKARMDFVFEKAHLGKYYATIQVEPVFVDEPESITVVTVLTYFF